VSQEKSREPTSFFPNPVYDLAYLNFSLKQTGPVCLSIYDPSGKIILNYEYNDQTPGQYSVPLSFEDQPPGLYFYTLKTTEGFASGKIIRVK
jgi:hypothetical protein